MSLLLLLNLKHVLLRVGIVPAPKLRLNSSRHGRPSSLASTKSDVFLGMGHARKSRRSLIASNQKFISTVTTAVRDLWEVTTRIPLGSMARTTLVCSSAEAACNTTRSQRIKAAGARKLSSSLLCSRDRSAKADEGSPNQGLSPSAGMRSTPTRCCDRSHAIDDP